MATTSMEGSRRVNYSVLTKDCVVMTRESEVVTTNTNVEHNKTFPPRAPPQWGGGWGGRGFNNWNEFKLKLLTSNHWRASLVPAAAVIPAPRVYTKVVAVKKLVVEKGVGGARVVGGGAVCVW